MSQSLFNGKIWRKPERSRNLGNANLNSTLAQRLSLRKGQTKGGKTIHNSIVPLSDNDYEIIAGLEAYSEIEKHSLLLERAVPSLIEGALED